jgi:transposase
MILLANCLDGVCTGKLLEHPLFWRKSMSLQKQAIDPVPQQTARVARAAFPKGNLYIRMRDEFATVFTDEHFADLFPTCGQPAHAPWQLALVTIMQFVEGLSDRQAADAVRARIDWKYALALTLENPSFDASVLCEFRARLLAGNAETRLFEQMLILFQERDLLKVRGRQRTDSTHVLAFVRGLHRVETLVETVWKRWSRPCGNAGRDRPLCPQQSC